MSTTITIFYDSNYIKPIPESMHDITMESEYIIGNASPVTITADSTVELKHCKITSISNNSKYIENLSNFGTYYRIKKASSVEIPYAIYILIGNTWIMTSKDQNGMVNLAFINEEYKESIPSRQVPINSIYVIGKTCTEQPCITIDDPAISANHLLMQFLPESIKLTDYKNGQGSTNGTWICFTGGKFIEGYLHLRIGTKTFLQVFKPVTQLPTVKSKIPYSFIPEYKKAEKEVIGTIKIDSSFGIKNTMAIDSSSHGTQLVQGLATSYYHPHFPEVQKLNLTTDNEIINIFLQIFEADVTAQKILLYKDCEERGEFAILNELIKKYKNAKYVKCAYIAADRNIQSTEQWLQVNPSFLPK
jgi:hypothetical protein